MELDLTKRQKEIFDYIRRYASKHGYPPTVREIGKAVGLTSSSTVHAHLANLEKIGLLKRDPTKPRAIELLIGKAKKALGPSGLPLVGQVAAGEPILAEEHIEEYLEIPDVIGGETGDFMLRVQGDSMKDAGILDGDFVVVRSGEDADNGEIVVALLGEEATVKRFYRENGKVRLQPANKAYKAIRTTEATVLGRVVGVFRRVVMSAVATRRPAAERHRAAAAGRPPHRRSSSATGSPSRTWSSRVWEDLALEGAAACPVCGGSMAPAGCQSCGAELD